MWHWCVRARGKERKDERGGLRVRLGRGSGAAVRKGGLCRGWPGAPSPLGLFSRSAGLILRRVRSDGRERGAILQPLGEAEPLHAVRAHGHLPRRRRAAAWQVRRPHAEARLLCDEGHPGNDGGAIQLCPLARRLAVCGSWLCAFAWSQLTFDYGKSHAEQHKLHDNIAK